MEGRVEEIVERRVGVSQLMVYLTRPQGGERHRTLPLSHPQ